MKEEALENCYASHKMENKTRKAIFVNEDNEEVLAIKDDDTEADYCDWLSTDYFIKTEET